MASSSSLECTICMENYNDTSRRPKVLACGHSLCVPCLDSCITRDMKECSVCRISFTAESLDDIPVNTGMEKLIQFVAQLSDNSKQTMKEIVEETQLNMDRVEATTPHLERIVGEKDKVISKKEAQIQSLNKEIGDCNKEKEEVLKCIEKNKNITAQMKDSFIHSKSSELRIKVEMMKEQLKHIEEKYDICCSFKIQIKTPSKKVDKDDRNMFVGGLNWDTTNGSLEKYFSYYGQIERCNVMEDPMTDQSKGYAFVLFADLEDMESALQDGSHNVDGRDVTTKKAIPYYGVGY